MKTVAVFEAKNRFSELLAAVAQGEEITITRHGSPVARLVALNAIDQATSKQSERVAAAIQRLRAVGAGTELGCTVQDAIQQGRA
ncbi:MAG: type II toxin-antitoxin system prevent-host-death family antitoxin [Comamonadaceae bacterium]|nr:type II toxin-antitoxin system prevent-host-death family antitoxin [Comamonadaceae bacterium]